MSFFPFHDKIVIVFSNMFSKIDFPTYQISFPSSSSNTNQLQAHLTSRQRHVVYYECHQLAIVNDNCMNFIKNNENTEYKNFPQIKSIDISWDQHLPYKTTRECQMNEGKQLSASVCH